MSDDWEIKINHFNNIINNGIKLNLEPIEIKNLNENFKSIQNKEFSLTIKDEDTNITDNFMKWFYLIQRKNSHNENNKIVFRKLTKPYPYKSKKKRIIKKWWKKYSEVVEINDVKLELK